MFAAPLCAASIARKLYLRQGLGVGMLSRVYGGGRRNGTRPKHFQRSSRGLLRHILHQLEANKIIERIEENGCVPWVLLWAYAPLSLFRRGLVCAVPASVQTCLLTSAASVACWTLGIRVAHWLPSCIVVCVMGVQLCLSRLCVCVCVCVQWASHHPHWPQGR